MQYHFFLEAVICSSLFYLCYIHSVCFIFILPIRDGTLKLDSVHMVYNICPWTYPYIMYLQIDNRQFHSHEFILLQDEISSEESVYLCQETFENRMKSGATRDKEGHIMTFAMYVVTVLTVLLWHDLIMRQLNVKAILCENVCLNNSSKIVTLNIEMLPVHILFIKTFL